MTATVQFTQDPAKKAQIRRIVKRWLALLRAQKIKDDRDALDWTMDLSALVGSGQVFDLDTLERFDDFNLAHDMRGIERHLDRRTGRLNMGIFMPRASRADYIEVAHAEDD